MLKPMEVIHMNTVLGHTMHCSVEVGLAMRFTPVVVSLVYLRAPFL